MYSYSKLIFLFFLTAITISGFAQQPGAKLYELPAENGEQAKITLLCQDKEGYIFCGTTNGLFRFDGIDFYKTEQAADVPKEVTAICEIPNKEIWVGFSNGNIASLKNNKIQLLHFEEGFPKAPIKQIITDDKNIIWIATAGEGVYYYVNNRLYNINMDDGLTDDYIYDIHFVKNLGIVAATDRGINICNLQNSKKIIKTYSSKNGLKDNIVRCLYTTQNDLWIGMQDGGVSSYTYNLKENIAPPVWKYGQVNDVVATSQQVFVATEDNGLVIYDHDGNDNLSSLAQNNLQLKKVSCLLRDREGNVWAAGNNLLMRTSGSNVQAIYHFTKELSEDIHCLLLARDESLWFNTASGLKQLKKEGDVWKEKYYPVPDITDTEISGLYEDINSTIWIGTMGKGIFLLNGNTGKLTALKKDSLLQKGNILSITGKDNTVWIASLEGVIKADITNNNISFTDYTDIKSIGSKYVYHIFTDSKDRVWFATDGKGLTVMQNNQFTDMPRSREDNGSVVYKVAEDMYGNIWYITYDNGLIKYDGQKFTAYTASNGLSDMTITGLAATKDNVLVFHKNSVDVINTGNGHISYLNAEQGIQNINTDLNSYAANTNADVYFIAGNAIFKYHASEHVTFQPSILIDNVQLFLNDINAEQGHSFDHNENNLSFYYTGLFYSQPDKILYQYKLEGYDKDWINTKDRIKNFPKLSPGTYTFRVRVSLSNDFNNAQEAGFAFTIENPFWLKPWFIFFSFFSMGVLLFLIVRQREKRVNKWNKMEREKIQSQLETLRNQINPHFLFNSFNTLISEIEEHPDRAVNYVEHLSDFYRSIVVHREKDLISLKEELNILEDYFFVQQKRYGRGLQIDIRISAKQALVFSIAPLALQLLIENAIKHNAVSGDAPVHIEIYIDEENYLVVHNNINKKLQPEKSSSMGLQNIQKRYALLSNKHVIIEQTEQYFTVKIPLIQNLL